MFGCCNNKKSDSIAECWESLNKSFRKSGPVRYTYESGSRRYFPRWLNKFRDAVSLSMDLLFLGGEPPPPHDGCEMLWPRDAASGLTRGHYITLFLLPVHNAHFLIGNLN